jgi:transcriptional regulator with XRE-family HTH domain
MRFRAILQSVLMQRRSINHRYSLRSLARALRIDHATLSQLMRGERRITGRTIRCLGPRLGLTAHQLEECRTLEHEIAIVTILTDPRFRPDSRWLAVHLNIPLDDVNIALQRLLYKRLIVMRKRTWHNTMEQ